MLAAFLVLAGNAASFLSASGLPGSGFPRLAFAALTGLALLAWSRAAGLTFAEVGGRFERAPLGAAFGALVGLAAAATGLLVLSNPPLVGGPITYAPARDVSTGELALHLALFLPVGVVLPEEIAFRGVLLAALARRTSAVSAVARSSLAFALWHATIVVPTIRETNLAAQPLLAALALVGAALVVFAGGVALAVLRRRAETLAASLAAHWAFNVAMLVGLRALG